MSEHDTPPREPLPTPAALPVDETAQADAMPPVPPRVELKAAALIVFMLLLLAASVFYVLYARGVFEPTQKLVLVADDSEGVLVGMDVTFSGFPIGQVSRIDLAPDGTARLTVNVKSRDAKWLRTSSVFTMERGLVGGTRIKAFSGILTDPPLPDAAERKVLIGDASAELLRLVGAARQAFENVQSLTDDESSLQLSLAHIEELTGKFNGKINANGKQGALGALLGESDQQKLSATLDETRALMKQLNGLSSKADTQVFGPKGLTQETRSAVVQMNQLLAETRQSLKKVDAVLVEAQGIAANTKAATTDLDAMRGDIDQTLRKVDGLITEINRKWPFPRDKEIKLP